MPVCRLWFRCPRIRDLGLDAGDRADLGSALADLDAVNVRDGLGSGNPSPRDPQTSGNSTTTQQKFTT